MRAENRDTPPKAPPLLPVPQMLLHPSPQNQAGEMEKPPAPWGAQKWGNDLGRHPFWLPAPAWRRGDPALPPRIIWEAVNVLGKGMEGVTGWGAADLKPEPLAAGSQWEEQAGCQKQDGRKAGRASSAMPMCPLPSLCPLGGTGWGPSALGGLWVKVVDVGRTP